ncbi:MAG: hypothetical protein VBE63_12880 [Lamprobacter sp.]|uniref:hypothetical protein n=1 Tax=Lamprobacter sp. TaxID=3100796 RepID=UPI002B25DFC7|nr:hypothetical protein [Lamprobacter sp.]MEA3640822.1 hypothetical protein [Lamprobacter sp.]
MRFPALIALALSLSVLLPASAFASDAADVMAKAMARMMEAMGLFDGDSAPAVPAMPSMMPGMGNVGYGQMPWSQMPWSQMPGYGAFSDPITAFGMQGMPNAPMATAMAWPWGGGSSGLDGIWEGRDGSLMILRGQRFRLQAAEGGHIEGLFQRRAQRIAFYEPSSESVRAYELAEQQGRLVLRDAAGSTYLYRRLWLDEPAAP